MIARAATLARFLAAHPARGAGETARVVANRIRRRTPLADELPWMPFDAIRFLAECLAPGAVVFEYGAGGSTLFLARRCARVVSVEHDAPWAERVARALQARAIGNVDLRAIPPESRPDPEFASAVGQYAKTSFRRYVERIDEFPDGHFDAIVVDGRARNACLARARPKAKPGGWIVLDNSERDKYAPGRAAMAALARRTFFGLNPYQLDPGETTFWRAE